MNNSALYDTDTAGGFPYPETESYEYEQWFTTVGQTDCTEYKTIRFNILQQNLLLHWRYSYLELHGQLVKKADGTAYDDGSKITFIHNAIPHLFSNVKLTVGTRLVENVNAIGHVSSLIFDILYPQMKAKCEGLQFLWLPDTDATVADTNKGFLIRRKYVIDEPNTNGTFSFRIPLLMFFGFMENFTALRGYPIDLEFVRGPDYASLIRDDAVEGKLKFTKILLNIPIVKPSNVMALAAMKELSNPKPYLFSFRQRNGLIAPVPAGILNYQLPLTTSSFTERPQMLWIGFQRGATTDQKFNYALYSNENVETMFIRVNNVDFPRKPVPANWRENDSGFFYFQQLHLRANYLQFPATWTGGNMITPVNFKDLYSIYCFDVSKQEFEIAGNSVSCELHVNFKTVTQANLRVYVAWFSDRTLELFADGRPLNIKSHVDSFIS